MSFKKHLMMIRFKYNRPLDAWGGLYNKFKDNNN
jgi:hypothetical protein